MTLTKVSGDAIKDLDFGSENIATTGSVTVGTGSGSSPSIVFDSDADTGIYSPGANQVAISTGGTGRLFVDASGRVGIGTTSPSRNLHLHEGSTSASYLQLTNSSTGTTSDDGLQILVNSTAGYIIQRENAPLTFQTNNTERARIDSSGRLLVGTSSSLGGTVSIAGGGLYLSANDSNAEMQLARASDNSGSPFYYFNKARGTYASPTVVSDGDICGTINFRGHDSSAYIAGASISALVDGTPGANDMPGRLVFSTTADGASSPTPRMTIKNDGRVGIGTSNPQTLSPGNTSLQLGPGSSGAQGSEIRLESHLHNGSGNGANISYIDDDLYIVNRESGPILLWTSLTERARIDSSGRLGLGVTAPARALHVVTASNDIARFESNITNGSATIELKPQSTSGLARIDVVDNACDFSISTVGKADALVIKNAGNVGIGTTDPAEELHVVGDIVATGDITAFYSSDRRLKKDIESIPNAVDKVKQINGVSYAWNDEYLKDKELDGYFVREREVGVIAQEIEEVLPELVATRDNGYKAVKYDRLVALLIEAVKEQQQQIDELKAKLEG